MFFEPQFACFAFISSYFAFSVYNAGRVTIYPGAMVVLTFALTEL